ncbi:hypothetical protein CcaCcLH18_03061 [Colletotrichum camelliae]|nr:hypothetical protein CcaCcLH18_03061 [Colletotrichum camelliae]
MINASGHNPINPSNFTAPMDPPVFTQASSPVTPGSASSRERPMLSATRQASTNLMAATWDKEPDIPCQYDCGKLFRFESQRKEHEQSHSAGKFDCPGKEEFLCDKFFNATYTLRGPLGSLPDDDIEDYNFRDEETVDAVHKDYPWFCLYLMSDFDVGSQRESESSIPNFGTMSDFGTSITESNRCGPNTQSPVGQTIHLTEPPAPDNNRTPSVHPTPLQPSPPGLHYHYRGPRHQIGDLVTPTTPTQLGEES